MEQYIPKSVLVAEIKSKFQKYWKMGEESDALQDGNAKYWGGVLSCLNEVKTLFDTLEVKEMQEDSASEDLEEAIGQSFIYHENRGDDFRSDKQIETAYRCGFKTGVKYKELASSITENIEKQNLEMREVDLDKKIKDYFDNQPIITRSKGIDYQLIPSGEDIAKHFFELGLKVAQKGKEV